MPGRRGRKNLPLGEMLDRLVERAADEAAGFVDLVAVAGLDRGRDFVGASLAGLDLRDEDLRGFDFSRADLRDADFTGANCEGVSFYRADVRGAKGLPPGIADRRPEAAAKRQDDPGPYDADEARRMILAGQAPPPAWVPSIRELNFDRTKLRDLRPMAGLTALTRLDFDDTQVADLAPLAGLAQLQWLSCNNTQVADLAPLAGLAQLQRLDLTGTPVTDLSPVAHRRGLEIIGKDALRTPAERSRRGGSSAGVRRRR